MYQAKMVLSRREIVNRGRFGAVLRVARRGISLPGRALVRLRPRDPAGRFGGLLEAAPDALVITDEGGRIGYVNERAEQLFGYRREELIGQPVELLLPERLRAPHGGHREEFMASPHARPMGTGLDLIARREDGSEFPVEISLSPLQTAQGTLVSAAIRDITARRQAEEGLSRLAAIVESAEDAIIGKTLEGTITSWNPGAERLYGYRTEEAIGQHISLLCADDQQRTTIAGVLACVADGQIDRTESVRRAKDGRLVEVAVTTSPIRNAQGKIVGASTIATDIGQRKQAERQLRAADERFRRAFEDAPIGMALVSLDGSIEQGNQALGVTCGCTRPELARIPLRELVHPVDYEQSRDELRALAAGQAQQVARDLCFIDGAGSAVDVAMHATLLRDEAGQPAQLLCQFLDITERKRFEEQLQFMADHDPLTGLANRRKFEAELDRQVAHVKRYGPDGALIVLDIDHFKQINDTLGHNAGDELIVSIAGILRERLRESDLLARLGGDEFAVLLPEADRREAAQVARALVLAVRTHAARLNGERKRVTTSVGVTMFDTDVERLTGESALIEADLAMYDAKEAGRNRYSFFHNSEHRVSRTKARLTWVNRIEHALEHDRFALFAQPIVDLRSGQVHQHELLLRMLDDHGDLIPPATFLYIAERFGLVGRIDEWVTHHTIGLLERCPELELAVNISGHSLGNQRLLASIENRMRSSTIDPGRLVLEVTETAAVANIAQAQAFTRQLRDLGCRFALDDFGAGFGSFYYLKHLPFDYVKIDGEFVQHASSGRIDQLVIKAVVGIAQGLGKETIAEFVTDERTKRMVKRLGVDYAQGHHIGKPIPAEDLFGTELAAAS